MRFVRHECLLWLQYSTYLVILFRNAYFSGMFHEIVRDVQSGRAGTMGSSIHRRIKQNTTWMAVASTICWKRFSKFSLHFFHHSCSHFPVFLFPFWRRYQRFVANFLIKWTILPISACWTAIVVTAILGSASMKSQSRPYVNKKILGFFVRF